MAGSYFSHAALLPILCDVGSRNEAYGGKYWRWDTTGSGLAQNAAGYRLVFGPGGSRNVSVTVTGTVTWGAFGSKNGVSGITLDDGDGMPAHLPWNYALNGFDDTSAYRLIDSAVLSDTYSIPVAASATDTPYYLIMYANAQGEAHVTLTEVTVADPAYLTIGVYADWDGDGFGGYGSTDDLTGDTASWTITRGASAEITGGAQPGSATVVLNNPADDRYNPLNAGGPLYGLLTDGIPFWIGVNEDGLLSGDTPLGLFGGRIEDITPIPQAGATVAPQVEITCEDALSWYGRTPAQLADGIGRSQAEIRAAILTDIGETRVSLPSEITTVPLSGWNGSALGALEELNAANGSRHFIKPEDVRDDWYAYTCRNRQWRLDATVDAAVDAGVDHLDGTSGWRLSADTVTNQQRATVTPVTFTSGQVEAWVHQALPFTITGTLVVWCEFDDYLDAPVVDYAYTGTAPGVALEAFGTTAKITLTTAGTTVFTALSVEGRLARRGTAESVLIDDTTSQAGTRGVRAGGDISGQFVGVLASARGLAAHVVWRYATPQYRPTITVSNWMPEQFEIDLYDILSVTIAELGMTARLFEVVGLTHYGILAASTDAVLHQTTFVLQECRVQTDPGWFILDTSLLNGTDILGY